MLSIESCNFMVARLPRTVWIVGWVSLCMDISSEMIYPLVPMFLAAELGASKLVIGSIEGVAEATASLLKLGSGMVADRFRNHKFLMGLGYGISTCSRPLLAMAHHWGLVLTARFVDRTGKGIRTAPRDAVIASVTPQPQLGLAYGIHRSMDTAGAILGPAVAVLLLTIWPADYRLVFWVSIVPGLIAVLLIVLYVQPDRVRPPGSRPPWRIHGVDARLREFLIVIGLFSLGNSSNAFVILKAAHAGITPAWISGLYLIFNLVYCAVAVPSGMLSDRVGRERVIALGFAFFALVYAGLASTNDPWLITALFVLYGLYMGLTEGVQRAYVATLAPEDRQATGFGLYHMVVGLTILPASLIAGWLWDHLGPSAPFWFGSFMAGSAMTVFVWLRWIRAGNDAMPGHIR
ncbi:MAG: MFS transporter [Nitrospirae bacterium]|nr:MAG: MFS transporter [Nitrospirota bacterium]